MSDSSCLSEFAQTHVHWVSDAIQPSHPLSSPSPPAFNLSQQQGFPQWVGSSHQVAKVLEPQLQSTTQIFGSHCTLCLWIPLYFMSHFLIRTELHVAKYSFLWRPSRAKLIFLAYSQWPTNPSITPQRFHPLQMLSVFKRATYFFFQSKYFKRFLK